jgi:NhaA family Na+:H+ antiporter
LLWQRPGAKAFNGCPFKAFLSGQVFALVGPPVTISCVWNHPMSQQHHAPPSAIRRFLEAQSSAGLVLMAAAVAALIIANSPLRAAYEALFHAYIGPLSLGHWINDGLMAVFFLLVGLEIKREMLDGQLSTWPRRVLPGIAAAGGMIAPALIYLAFNRGATAAGWAIPAATDIAFALGVIALLGKRVPASLRVFLAALAIIDDLGAVAIIALFYTAELSLFALAGVVVAIGVLVALNRAGVRRLSPYLAVGLVLWVLVLLSGVHATLAGVMLALTIPMERTPSRSDADCHSPLHRLEHALHLPVAFVILPIFGLANAAVPVFGLPAGAFVAPVTLGVAFGLLLGKVVGVFGFASLAVGLGLADMPARSTNLQLLGVALLCGIGFTMSIFITLLAFPGNPLLQSEAKIGVLAGSLMSGLLGYMILRVAQSERLTGSGERASPFA